MERLHNENEVVLSDTTRDPVVPHGNHLLTLQEGRATFAQVFTVAVVFVLGMQGLKFITPWYDYLRLKGTMQKSVNQAQVSTDEAVISAVLGKAKQLQVPLAPRDIHLERSSYSGTRLWAAYEVTLTFPLGFWHTPTFRPEVRSAR
jgi:hypothetical protein